MLMLQTCFSCKKDFSYQPERFDGLIRFLPGFLVYAGIVYFLFGLHASKWRFTSLPDLFNIVRAATVLALSLLVLDYILFRNQAGVIRSATVRRLDEDPSDRGPNVFGSDHHPLLARIELAP